MSAFTTKFKFLIFFAFVVFSGFGKAQAQNVVYGNEWINYNQSYYKINILKDGLYKITAANLAAAGITGVDPDKFQIFRRGKELAIYVKKTPANSTDFIEFYGHRNDGALDTALFLIII